MLGGLATPLGTYEAVRSNKFEVISRYVKFNTYIARFARHEEATVAKSAIYDDILVDDRKEDRVCLLERRVGLTYLYLPTF